MRLLQFSVRGRQSLGAEVTPDGDIVDLCAADEDIPNRMIDFIREGSTALELSRRILTTGGRPVVPRDQVEILAPVTQPDKVVCVCHNYLGHVTELGHSVVEAKRAPEIFNKFPSTIVAHEGAIKNNGMTKTLDWEVELAFVIGKQANNVEICKASDYIFGYTVATDVTAREFAKKEFNGGQNLLGKSMDTFCPLGPVLVTKDEIQDPQNLDLKCTVNGVLKQSSNTKNMIHTCAAVVAYVSQFVTLLPGDVVLTGTPPGVGASRKPPEYLKTGDVVECEIQNIGKLQSKVV